MYCLQMNTENLNETRKFHYQSVFLFFACKFTIQAQIARQQIQPLYHILSEVCYHTGKLEQQNFQ